MNEIELAYFAGIVDGEGCIFVWTYPARPPRHNYEYKYLRIEVTNTEPQIVNWCLVKAGAGFVRAYEASSRGVKPVYRWIMTGKKAEILYEQLKPYLKSRRFPGMVRIDAS